MLQLFRKSRIGHNQTKFFSLHLPVKKYQKQMWGFAYIFLLEKKIPALQFNVIDKNNLTVSDTNIPPLGKS